MEIRAKANFIRVAPRKTRLLVDLIRSLTVREALDQLKYSGKLAAQPLLKLVNSAVANAEHNYELKQDNLYIKEIKADEGPVLRRWMPKAHGRATPIMKRTSHITLVLDEIEASGVKAARKQVLEEPVKLSAKPKADDGVKIKSEKGATKGEAKKEEAEEIEKAVHDPRREGKGKHTKIEGGSHRGFVGKLFRRKSG